MSLLGIRVREVLKDGFWRERRESDGRLCW
jgi:hypothetical protein